jgi:hypothetical protein
MSKPKVVTDDVSMGKFVYCNQHLAVHATGWCSVDVRDKIPMKADNIVEAVREARTMGLKLHSDSLYAGS